MSRDRLLPHWGFLAAAVAGACLWAGGVTKSPWVVLIVVAAYPLVGVASIGRAGMTGSVANRIYVFSAVTLVGASTLLIICPPALAAALWVPGAAWVTWVER